MEGKKQASWLLVLEKKLEKKLEKNLEKKLEKKLQKKLEKKLEKNLEKEQCVGHDGVMQQTCCKAVHCWACGSVTNLALSALCASTTRTPSCLPPPFLLYSVICSLTFLNSSFYPN